MCSSLSLSSPACFETGSMFVFIMALSNVYGTFFLSLYSKRSTNRWSGLCQLVVIFWLSLTSDVQWHKPVVMDTSSAGTVAWSFSLTYFPPRTANHRSLWKWVLRVIRCPMALTTPLHTLRDKFIKCVSMMAWVVWLSCLRDCFHFRSQNRLCDPIRQHWFCRWMANSNH